MNFSSHDPITSVIVICREAIEYGLVDENIDRFDHTVNDPEITNSELEDYLQDIWDKVR